MSIPTPDPRLEDDEDFVAAVVEVAATLPKRGNGKGATLAMGNIPDSQDAFSEPFRSTDLWNARFLVHLFRDRVRYCERMGGWFHYSGKRWARAENGEVERFAKETVRHLYTIAAAESDETRRRELAKHATRSEAAGKIMAMLELAKSEEEVAISPEGFDADPWLFNTETGTVNLRTGEEREHRAEDHITNLASAPFDLDATCPTYERFLSESTGGDETLISFLRRARGYSLTGITREQALFFKFGPEASGKSTDERIVQAIMGSYARTAEIATFLTSRRDAVRNDLAGLAGARMVSATEPDEGQTFDETLVKQLTGEDRIKARFLFRENFEFSPTFKIWLCGNHRPHVRSTGGATWRRVHVLPFNRTVPEEKRDGRLFKKLMAERAGILAWMIRGCVEWQRDGLHAPDAVRTATAEYRQAEDILAPFIEECCVVGGAVRATAKSLFAAYRKWCEEAGERVMSQKRFGMRLDDRGFDSCRGTSGTRYWLGIGLRNDVSDTL